MCGLLVVSVTGIRLPPIKHLGSTKPLRSTTGAEALESGVLVVDGGPRQLTPGWPAGLWLINPAGERQNSWAAAGGSKRGIPPREL